MATGKRSIEKFQWFQKPFPYEVGVDGFKRQFLEKLENGWFDAQKYRPLQYELVLIKTDINTKRRKTGWWDGLRWEGFRLQKEESVLYWKPEKEEE